MVKVRSANILQQRKKCNLDIDLVSRETGISTKLIEAVEMSNRKPFSSVLSYKMAEQKLLSYYDVKLKNTQKESNIPPFLRSKVNG